MLMAAHSASGNRNAPEMARDTVATTASYTKSFALRGPSRNALLFFARIGRFWQVRTCLAIKLVAQVLSFGLNAAVIRLVPEDPRESLRPTERNRKYWSNCDAFTLPVVASKTRSWSAIQRPSGLNVSPKPNPATGRTAIPLPVAASKTCTATESPAIATQQPSVSNATASTARSWANRDTWLPLATSNIRTELSPVTVAIQQRAATDRRAGHVTANERLDDLSLCHRCFSHVCVHR